jgi:hypothetical protein
MLSESDLKALIKDELWPGWKAERERARRHRRLVRAGGAGLPHSASPRSGYVGAVEGVEVRVGVGVGVPVDG